MYPPAALPLFPVQLVPVEDADGAHCRYVPQTRSDAGTEVISMRNKSNRLEELFMHLVEEGQI